MENLFTELLSLIDFKYVLSQIFMSYIVLYFIVKKPRRKEKYLATLLCGIVLGIVWYLFILKDLSVLILSFVFASFAYDWIIKHITNKFLSYHDK